jgi:hypothetical protein
MGKMCFICKEKYGSFAYTKQSEEIYCFTCKLDGMYNVKKNICIVCNKSGAIYALIGEEKAKYCGKCRVENTLIVY